MSDVVKWGILVAAIGALIVTILTFPFVQYLPTGSIEIAHSIDNVLVYCGNAFSQARAFINMFLLPIGRTVLSGLMVYLFTSWLAKLTIKITAWVIHFIFK